MEAAAAGGVAEAGADASAVAVFFDLADFWAVVELVALAPGPAEAESAVSDFLLFLDFAEEAPLAAVEESADASPFFDFADCFEADVSAAVEPSAASDLFDLEDFFALELSGVAGEPAVSVFFFLDFAAVVSLWSVVVGVCAAWAADTARRLRFASTSRRATSRTK
jgi:hypothetical protein